jgi:molybdopterin molybdotransferase
MTRTDRTADWLTIREATDVILGSVACLDAETIDLPDAAGRTLATDVTAPRDQPPWDNSAMDGYAVRAEDVRGASNADPRRLKLVESIAAGEFPSREAGPGEAIRIMTGAPIPHGADSVIRIEHTRVVDAMNVEVLSAVDAGRNIRLRGEDLREGDIVVEKGALLRAGEIGVLATVGRARVQVCRRPRIAILSTGNELVDLDGFDEVLAGRRIVNSNSYALAAACSAVGALPVLLGIAPDESAAIRDRVEGVIDRCDALVTSAGASVGEHDVVKDALETLGMNAAFWRVKIRPGSPFSFGTIQRAGQAPLPVFGLPGNPVSAIVTFEILVKPAIRAMLGRRAIHPPTILVRVGRAIESRAGLVRFLRVRLANAEAGLPTAELTGNQGSGVLTSVARADALLVVPLDFDTLEAGDVAVAVPLQEQDAAQIAPGF